METNQDNKIGRVKGSLSISWSIVIASIVIVIGFIVVQAIQQTTIEEQDIRNQVYKETQSDPYESCLRVASNKHEAQVSFIRSLIDDELRQCNEGIRCVRTTDEIMGDLRRSMDTAEKEYAAEEERCVSLYK